MPIHDWTRVDHGTFHDFHQGWCPAIRTALNTGLLPPDYSAMVEQHADGGIPDVLTLEVATPPGNGANGSHAGPPAGLVSVAVAPPKARENAASRSLNDCCNSMVKIRPRAMRKPCSCPARGRS